MMTSSEIREAFLKFFEEAGHERVASAPLPQKDNPTLLFTNAGMNQFTNVFLGLEQRPYRRAVTAQKVMRVSGKHNDLENVGPSTRHHTFFEMLGNFSFGDYFKEEAIDLAWTFLTEELALDKERLWVTIFEDDDEAYELWQKHVPVDRILRFDKKENFWEMGDVGPCGPCSEIHYYQGPLEDMTPSGVNVLDNYIEVWNLVFMQFEKDGAGGMTPLPRPSIDTGMGLERVTMVLQDVVSNYDTDLFSSAMDVVQELRHHTDEEREKYHIPYRVIADHVRAASFLIADGVRPGNDGADYVLRMVIRRAAKFGRELGFSGPFMAYVAKAYINEMGDAYPELKQHEALIGLTLSQEEERFARTIDNALVQLDKILSEPEVEKTGIIPGETAFQLYATHGLPLEITRDIAGERGVKVDESGYRFAREAHAQASGEGKFRRYETGENVYAALLKDLVAQGLLEEHGVSQQQYGDPRLEAPIVALLHEGDRTDIVRRGDEVEVVTAVTPFYVEAGGQISDIGMLTVPTTGGQIKVESMRQPIPGLIVHAGRVIAGELRLGERAMLRVDDERRTNIRRNHTATHLLHEELRRQLGKHVTQAGSLVAPDRLRFDFTHPEALTENQIREIENGVNEAILANYPVTVTFMGQREAIEQGAMALFGEKYANIVRTIQIGNQTKPYSFELCGGLHVKETNDINLFHILNETSVSAGVRRIEALTGRAAREYLTDQLAQLNRLLGQLNAPAEEAEGRLTTLLEENRALQKENAALKRQILQSRFEQVLGQTRQVDGVTLLTAEIAGADADLLRELTDRFRSRVKSGVAVLGTVREARPLLVAMVTDDWVARGLNAGGLVREAAKLVGGGGGGRPNLAQAGGRDPEKLAEALAAIPGLLQAQLNQAS